RSLQISLPTSIVLSTGLGLCGPPGPIGLWDLPAASTLGWNRKPSGRPCQGEAAPNRPPDPRSRLAKLCCLRGGGATELGPRLAQAASAWFTKAMTTNCGARWPSKSSTPNASENWETPRHTWQRLELLPGLTIRTLCRCLTWAAATTTCALSFPDSL